jgi:hypothetical protein
VSRFGARMPEFFQSFRGFFAPSRHALKGLNRTVVLLLLASVAACATTEPSDAKHRIKQVRHPIARPVNPDDVKF